MSAAALGVLDVDRAGRERSRKKRANERGAVLVEAIFVIPIMLALTFGAIEFGIAYNQKGNLEAATRAGARKGAVLFSVTENAQNTAMTDEVQTAVNAALADGTLPVLEGLYVYKAVPGFDPKQPGDCALDCVYYQADANGSQFLAATPGAGWPSADRNGCGATPDKISVKVISHHDTITKIIPVLPNTITISSISTLQFEPNACP
jgi:hypothetical protein